MHPLVPGFILENYASRQMSGAFSAVGVFVDISGFSSMTDAFMEHGPHGAETLAGVIRAVFSPAMRVVFEQGGFVINQAGDSFTAVFPLAGGTGPGGTDAIARALRAAWQIQEQAGAQPTFETPYGSFAISVKIGLAWGDCAWQILESKTEERAVYYFRGAGIDRCSEAEHLAGPGEIILDESIFAAAEFQGRIEVEPRGSAYRLLNIRGELLTGSLPGGNLPQPVTVRQPENHLELARRFYPESVLTSATSGEFRQVVSLFISLPTVRTKAQLAIFMETFFQLQARYGGLLSRLSFGDKGSHLFAFWGAPIAYENDLERAFQFILELQARTEIPINGGITNRLAHTGFIGSDLAEEYTGYGRGVNLAARFMTSAARGEIWVDEPSARQAGIGFVLEPLGKQRFKGFTQPQEVYLLLERKEQVVLVYEGDLVGREKELDALRRFVQPVFSGEYGGALVVWGEPGMGKSRLVHDFLSRMEETGSGGSQLFLGQCDEILRQSLNPFRYWLARYFDQSREQSDARNKRGFNRKLDELVSVTQDTHLARELDRTRSCLGALVGLEWPDSLYQQLDAQGRFENTLLGLAVLLQAESRRKPVIFFLEDAHWLDDDSKIFLPRLLQLLSGDRPADGTFYSSYPVAVIATARFEGARLPLETFPYQEIRLGELDRAALSGLAAAHLGEVASASLLSLLSERSEGNPFFAEQILRYLQEEGWLVLQAGEWQIGQEKRPGQLIPANVQAVLVARLDRLADEVRQVVKTAAVLGREFEIRVLAEMFKNDRFLPDKVKKAEQAAVWVALNEIRYIFRHALMRDAAYSMQIQARREALHALALDALERLYLPEGGSTMEDLSASKTLAPHYGELAYHAEQAGSNAKAIDYLTKAGDTAREAYQNTDAIDFYTRALALTGPQTGNDRLQHLYIERGQILERAGCFEQALADYDRLAALAQERHDPAMELESLMARSVIFSIETSLQDRERGVRIARQALELARSLNDRTAEARALDHLSTAKLFLTQDPNQSLPDIEQAIAIARELNQRDLLAHALVSSAGMYIFALGQFDIGQAEVAEAVTLWQELGKPYRAGEALQDSGLGYVLSGDYPLAIRQLEAANQVNQTIGSAWGQSMCASMLGTVYWDQGEYDQALSQIERAIRFGDESGYLMGRIMCRGLLSIFYGTIGRIPEAIALCQQALVLSESKGQAFKALVLASLAWIYVFQGDQAQAEGTIHQAWDALQQRVSFPTEPSFVAVVDAMVAQVARDWPRLQSAAERARGMMMGMHNRLLLVDATYLLGQALLAQNHSAEARSILEEALLEAEEIGCRRMLWSILFALTQCEVEDAQKQQWLSRARETVRSIAGGITNPEWRDSFLGQAFVKVVLGQETL